MKDTFAKPHVTENEEENDYTKVRQGNPKLTNAMSLERSI